MWVEVRRGHRIPAGFPHGVMAPGPGVLIASGGAPSPLFLGWRERVGASRRLQPPSGWAGDAGASPALRFGQAGRSLRWGKRRVSRKRIKVLEQLWAG